MTRVRSTTVADAAGAGLLVFGVAMVYQPAGFMVAGVLVLAASWSAAGRGDDAP